MKLGSLHDLYLDELRDLLDAENQLAKAYPRLVNAATNEELQSVFADHLAETREHIQRLERIFDMLDLKAHGKKCDAMEGLLAEAKKIAHHDADDSVKDAGLIAAAQKIEHYEMAGYGCVRTWARLLGNDNQADILQQTLDEESESDRKLTDLAERIVNMQAIHA